MRKFFYQCNDDNAIPDDPVTSCHDLPTYIHLYALALNVLVTMSIIIIIILLLPSSLLCFSNYRCPGTNSYHHGDSSKFQDHYHDNPEIRHDDDAATRLYDDLETHHHDDPEGDPVVKAAVLYGYGHDQPTCRKKANIKEKNSDMTSQ
jgi:hypothetical protein